MTLRSLRHDPVVSIVTPTLNMGAYLERCIASVQAQTYPHIEHIVLDACSSDGTVELLTRTPGVRWTSEPDRGQSDAINKGLRMATGDIRGWLNADDELFPDAVRLIVEAFRATPGAGLVYGDIELIEGSERRRVRPSPTFSWAQLWKGNSISQPGTFWTRWAQELVGELDEFFHLTMDYELWLRFARAEVPAVYIAEPLARFEVHEASKTGSAGTLAFAEEELRALRKHGEIHGGAMVLDRWYWDDVVHRLVEAAEAGRKADARSIAREALPRMRPVLSRTRWFLWLARFAPALAREIYRRSGGLR